MADYTRAAVIARSKAKFGKTPSKSAVDATMRRNVARLNAAATKPTTKAVNARTQRAAPKEPKKSSVPPYARDRAQTPKPMPMKPKP